MFVDTIQICASFLSPKATKMVANVEFRKKGHIRRSILSILGTFLVAGNGTISGVLVPSPSLQVSFLDRVSPTELRGWQHVPFWRNNRHRRNDCMASALPWMDSQ
mmetsp:Transcript_20097/g.30217  ORF Transcript_20097/g.30217 Transcript_20097/m.30217 type:complete len:105 (+) Transcript_20097:188-502(+)